MSSWKVPLRTGLLVSALVIAFSLTAGEGWFAGLEHQLLDWRFTFTARQVPTDPRIRLIRMEVNGGAYVARNRGLDEATGAFAPA